VSSERPIRPTGSGEGPAKVKPFAGLTKKETKTKKERRVKESK
jgi:hypothetical protein